MDRRAALVEALASRGGPRLPDVEWHQTIGSTSDRLKQLARAGAPEWTAVLADRQTSGRGREGRTWQSPAGGLYLSVLLRPRAEPVSLLPLAAGVAVAEAVAGFGVACQLKWPNDVLASGRKLAGILAEATSGSTRRARAPCGRRGRAPWVTRPLRAVETSRSSGRLDRM